MKNSIAQYIKTNESSPVTSPCDICKKTLLLLGPAGEPEPAFDKAWKEHRLLLNILHVSNTAVIGRTMNA